MSEFVWHVSQSGYEWQYLGPHPDQHEAVLATVLDKGYRTYKPMESGPLFQEFASLGTDPDKFLAFANRYGHLTEGAIVMDEEGYEVDNDASEQFKKPKKKIDRLGLVMDIEFPTEREGRSVWLGHSLKIAQLTRQWESYRNQVSDLARIDISKTGFAQELVDILNHRVKPVFEPSGALSHEPTDLISALYLQLTQAVSGNRIHKQCPNCARWFEVSIVDSHVFQGRRVRRDKKYCSDKCRMSAHYRREEKPVTRATSSKPRKGKRRRQR